ncbi:hypothetical protein LTR53_005543 [Teratosphaeriaceae sp. CCFEE 6253]|nr:hypothetical protein LTR53_005543 [Teratosphaeriaceae sp. CCFEE 6253]
MDGTSGRELTPLTSPKDTTQRGPECRDAQPRERSPRPRIKNDSVVNEGEMIDGMKVIDGIDLDDDDLWMPF